MSATNDLTYGSKFFPKYEVFKKIIKFKIKKF